MNISYRYYKPDMVFTNDREEVINRIQTGKWDCMLCPQMFGCEYGYYGLFIPDKQVKRTREEAEKWLSGMEQSGREVLNNGRFNPENFSDTLPESLYPNQI